MIALLNTVLAAFMRLAQAAVTLLYMRTAVTLSIARTMPFVAVTWGSSMVGWFCPMKCSTMSPAIVSSRSSRVIKWYCRANSCSTLDC